MHDLALSQAGALVLTAWGTLFVAAATITLALFTLFPAWTALRQIRDARNEPRYEQAFQDALRRAWIAANSGQYTPTGTVLTETKKVMEEFTQIPNVLDFGDNVDNWLGIVWPKMKKRILND